MRFYEYLSLHLHLGVLNVAFCQPHCLAHFSALMGRAPSMGSIELPWLGVTLGGDPTIVVLHTMFIFVPFTCSKFMQIWDPEDGPLRCENCYTSQMFLFRSAVWICQLKRVAGASANWAKRFFIASSRHHHAWPALQLRLKSGPCLFWRTRITCKYTPSLFHRAQIKA